MKPAAALGSSQSTSPSHAPTSAQGSTQASVQAGATGRTLIHVTHEAVEHLGGIGTVLAGLITAEAYQKEVARSIFVGPLPYAERPVREAKERLGHDAVKCLYSGIDHHDPAKLGAIFRPLEWAFNTPIVYGTRLFARPGDEAVTYEAEVLLIDVRNPDPRRLAELKWHLWEHHQIDSARHEHNWDYEEYVRLALTAYPALRGLLGQASPVASKLAVDRSKPATVVAHEFMGIPTALRCIEDAAHFNAVFHAHECSTARRLCEHHPAMDIAFYTAMYEGMRPVGSGTGKSVGEVFSDQSSYARHALVSRVHVMHASLAVGPQTADELKFLSPHMRASNVRIAYNGLPARPVSFAQRAASRALVDQWMVNLLGAKPDYLITHVTRPVPSKGLWRDVMLLRKLAPLMAEAGKTCVYLLLTTACGVRSEEQVRLMQERYAWPAVHQSGFPDLVGPEEGLARDIASLNTYAASLPMVKGQMAVRGMLINQFGFTPSRLGRHAPAGITTADLRRAADVELGMSTYEPYGIAQLEPLHAGAICIPSTTCGCVGLVKRAMAETGLEGSPLVLLGDFVEQAVMLGEGLKTPLELTAADLLKVEDRVCGQLAMELMKRLPTGEAQQREYLRQGQLLAEKMGWERVVATDFVPSLPE
jgi:hypothetical protein